MSLMSRIKAWDPTDSGRAYTSRGIRRWRTQSLLAVPGAIWMLVGGPQTPEVYWHVPILAFGMIMAATLVFHPIAGLIGPSPDEMEAKLAATASVDTLSVLVVGMVVTMLYSLAVGVGLLPEMPLDVSLTDISVGLFFTVLSVRSVIMSFRIEPLDEEGEPAAPVAPISLPMLLIGAALLIVTALFAATAATKGPRDLAALSEIALEECGRGNVKSVSIAEDDYGFTCHTASDEAP